MPVSEEKSAKIGQAAAAAKGKTSAAEFVRNFASHYQNCVSLAKRFTVDDPDVSDSAALGQLCRASQEMLDQAKEARVLTEIYLALDEQHRDAVRPMITERFKDIARLAKASWLRFTDGMQIARLAKPEIVSAHREFEPQAERFQRTLQEFISLSSQTM